MGAAHQRYFQAYTAAAPLATFRVAFGLLVLASVGRFWAKGWIEELYLKPKFFFPYYGLEWIKPLGPYTYGLFVVCGLAALLVALGWWYRTAALALFASFTYIELMDKSTYLNHYYFVSLAAFLLVLLPAGRYFSVDAHRAPTHGRNQVPRWTVDALRLLVAIVYCYAGLAKLNSDWLLQAMPLRIWLPAKNDLWLVGPLFNYPWVAYAFSWFGAFYDLTVPFFLLYRPTRPWAYAAVVVFHVLTAVLFPIGMFPYVMIVAALIFFPAEAHERFVARLRGWWQSGPAPSPARPLLYAPRTRQLLLLTLGVFFVVQLLLPFRYLLYPRELFWTEEGYRFSWRVMLMEKMGQVEFKVVDGQTGRARRVNNYEHLSVLQEKMMSTQPDMMVQFARYLRAYYAHRGVHAPKVYADAYVSLNGRLGKSFIDPTVDLAQASDDLQPKPWILPFDDEISGF
ncbi:HTTM domain-containing protein [Hymenobacter psychrophilus]|uniref:Vitamin K-dependent gamma-carboxylase n=1 Tax=Hymenobacter psychrophilus TaxID=651662 RepID=A0A1H3MUE8_9BACT|nr:HTTM domain-containing protein [Hymenobacter psychrophilus]SDY80193.1 Vitamin K-dependent gamma-carboxylase [Hymenobacter psychrophilus]